MGRSFGFGAGLALLLSRTRALGIDRATWTGSFYTDLLGVDHERVRLWTFARAAAEPRDEWNDDALALARALAP
jgi:branched-subunit amino acid ABC-type transport system permease component